MVSNASLSGTTHRAVGNRLSLLRYSLLLISSNSVIARCLSLDLVGVAGFRVGLPRKTCNWCHLLSSMTLTVGILRILDRGLKGIAYIVRKGIDRSNCSSYNKS